MLLWGFSQHRSGTPSCQAVRVGLGSDVANSWQANLGLYSAVEAWAWGCAEVELVGRPEWDGQGRRPSHADKRKALQREALREEIRAVAGERADEPGFQKLATRLLDPAA
jgi:hypothetical protein